MLTQNLFSCNPSNEATKKFPYFKTGEKFFRPLSNICANSLFQTGDTYAETGENCTKDFPDFPRIYQEDHWHTVSIQTLKTQPGQCSVYSEHMMHVKFSNNVEFPTING